MSRTLVLCLDGTSNEPETSATNVTRIHDLALKNPYQLVHHDPGVGTIGARSATTPLALTGMLRGAGLVLAARRYEKVLAVARRVPLPASHAVDGQAHPHSWPWAWAGRGWRPGGV